MAGTTNFLIFNPNQTNQETDAQWSSDTLRTGGAATNAILPSPMFNKFAYSQSTFTASFANALAQKGYSPTDTSPTALQAIFSNILTQADVLPSLLSVSYAPTLTFDGSIATGFQVSLFGNLTSSSFVNLKIGQTYTFVFIQDSVGSRTVSWPPQMASAPQPDATPAAVSIFHFLVLADGTVHPSSPQIVS